MISVLVAEDDVELVMQDKKFVTATPVYFSIVPLDYFQLEKNLGKFMHEMKAYFCMSNEAMMNIIFQPKLLRLLRNSDLRTSSLMPY